MNNPKLKSTIVEGAAMFSPDDNYASFLRKLDPTWIRLWFLGPPARDFPFPAAARRFAQGCATISRLSVADRERWLAQSAIDNVGVDEIASARDDQSIDRLLSRDEVAAAAALHQAEALVAQANAILAKANGHRVHRATITYKCSCLWQCCGSCLDHRLDAIDDRRAK
jgi:hypothetical protein